MKIKSEYHSEDVAHTEFRTTLESYKYSAPKQLHSVSHAPRTADGRTATNIALLIDRKRRQASPARSPPGKRQRTSVKRDTHAKYAHLPILNDVLAPDLLVLFIGLNPGLTTAETGHAYAHKSNLFWKLLHTSGLTDRRCSPTEDVTLPEHYGYGFTNIVSRPTREGSELSKAELVAGTPVLEAKAREWKPKVCCLVGKGIWEAVWKWRHGKAMTKTDFKYGWQDDAANMGMCDEWTGSRVFVAASTSGASASLRPAEKEAIWKPLGDYVKEIRSKPGRAAHLNGPPDHR